MVSARLAQIQDNLSHLYEQLGSKEKALIQADEEEKTRIEQEIWEIKKKIQRDEKELEGLGLKQDATGTKSKFVISLWPPKIEWTIEGEQNIQDVKKFLQENSQKFLQSMRLHRRKMVGVGLSLSLMGLSGVYVLQPEWLNPVIEALGLHQKTVKILVAEFDGPDPQKYRVTENILRAIKGKTKDYKDVEIVGLENRITEREGKVVARKVGLEQKADIVIWGWYGATDEKAQVSVNFELLTKLNGLPELGEEEQGKVRTMAVTELKSFRIQGNLAQELTYLSLVTLGVSRYAAEDWDGTITRLTNAQESMKVRSEALDPSAIYFYRATAYLRKGDKDHALTDYSKAIQLNPKLAEAYNNRGVAYSENGNTDRAIADYNQALKINPNDDENYNNRGVAYYKKGNNYQALTDYSKAIQLNPKLAKAYNNRGIIYSDKGDEDQAIVDYNQALQLNPNNTEAYSNRGNVYREKGDINQAITDYNKALQLNPNNAEAYNNRGNAYRDKGDMDRAIADYSRSLQLNPQLGKTHVLRGIAYSYKGDIDWVITDYSRALQLNPSDTDTYVIRGDTYRYRDDIDHAIVDYSQALQLNPKLTEAYNNRGFIFYDQGNLTEAMRDWQKAISIDGSQADPQMALAVTLYQQGNLVEAKSLARKALQLDKRYRDLQFLKKEAIWSDKLLQQATKFFSVSGI